MTAQVFRYYCGAHGVGLGKFVIPNPFGPYEEPRYTAYLMKNWLAGETPSCSSPAYVRDNIHVSLLAKAYARFAAGLPDAPGFTRLNPSGYAESQGAFTLRLAQEMRPRLELPCAVELKKQTDFPEPRVRINTDIPDVDALGWSESAAWDEFAAYYVSSMASECSPVGESAPARRFRAVPQEAIMTSRCAMVGLASNGPPGRAGPRRVKSSRACAASVSTSCCSATRRAPARPIASSDRRFGGEGFAQSRRPAAPPHRGDEPAGDTRAGPAPGCRRRRC